MHLEINRLHSRWGATVGALVLDGVFQCFTLEDPHREEKIAGETRIPAGEYAIDVRAAGGMHARYAEKFSSYHQGMLWLRGVPDFEWVYLHIGNSVSDTEGCILLGNIAKRDQVLSSTNAYREVYGRVIAAALAGDLTITVRDEPEGSRA